MKAVALAPIATKENTMKLTPGQSADFVLEKSHRFDQRIYDTVTALFLPTRYYNDRLKQWDYDHLPFWFFREFLFDLDIFSDKWSSKVFRDGIVMLNDICQATEDHPTDRDHFDKYELAFRLYSSDIDECRDLHSATIELLSNLAILKANPDLMGNIIDIEDVEAMAATLKLLAACQTIYMDAKPLEE